LRTPQSLKASLQLPVEYSCHSISIWVTGNPFDRIYSDLDERTTKLRCEVEGSIGRTVKCP
ncbi:MAG: hypothetical protein ACOVLE_17985, partial [Pirellula staleyi]